MERETAVVTASIDWRRIQLYFNLSRVVLKTLSMVCINVGFRFDVVRGRFIRFIRLRRCRVWVVMRREVDPSTFSMFT